MIELKPMPMATVSPGVPALLQEGYYVQFSDSWPSTLSNITYEDRQNGITKGKFFQVAATNQVTYDLSYKIPANDFRDIDFSNIANAENLYPTNPKTLYEVQMGFKDANLLAYFNIPAGEYVSRLEQSSMVPPTALPFSATLRYLGAKKPEDSPYNDKRIYLYFIKDMEPFIMRLFVDNGVDFDKCVVGLVVNKCYLDEIKPNHVSDQMKSKAKVIRYYSELRW
jgi:hypothetical protein